MITLQVSFLVLIGCFLYATTTTCSGFVLPEHTTKGKRYDKSSSSFQVISRRRRRTRVVSATVETTTTAPTSSQSICWEEISIEEQSRQQSQQQQQESSSSSLGERLKWGESVIQLKDVVTEEECRFLRRACTDFASQTTGTELEKPGLLRLPTIAAAKRAEKTKTPCADPLPTDIDELVQEILLRVVNIMDHQLPRSLVETLFFVNGVGHDGGEEEEAVKSLSKRLQRDQLKFSSREPAINVYTTGGEFLAHKDAQALTVLLPLSSETVHFEGGGTAFWSQDSRGHRVEDPSIVLKPNAGTVLLFGGCVTHAGQPLLSGTRVVFVASFSPMIGQQQQQQQQQVEENFVPQRDIYGDSM